MIINDLDDYYIVFDTKNRNTELDTLFNIIGGKFPLFYNNTGVFTQMKTPAFILFAKQNFLSICFCSYI